MFLKVAIYAERLINIRNISYLLFNTRTHTHTHICMYIYIHIILYCVGWLFGFYGISTFVGHSTPNSVYIYKHIQPKISKRILR